MVKADLVINRGENVGKRGRNLGDS